VGESSSDPEAQFAAQVEAAVLRDLEADRIELPPMPMVAVRIFGLLADPDYEVREVAALIESDPLVAVEVVRLTNSAIFAGRQPITSVRDCVTRLGRLELRMFLFELSARRAIESRDPGIVALSRGLWEHSLAVAFLSREITRGVDRQRAEEAYLAGLLHDVGKPLLAALLLAAEHRLRGQRTSTWLTSGKWLAFILAKHRSVGMALARQWGLPEAIGRSISEGVDYDANDTRSLTNAVRLANTLAKLDGLYVGTFDRDEVQAAAFVGQQLFDLDQAAVDALLAKAREQIQRRAA
jgi:putative nucleotidyltransferase with HDIG domain